LRPSGGYISIFSDFGGWLKSILLPSIALSLVSSAVLTRMVRSAFLENMGEYYVKTARSKGLSENKVLFKHILKNALSSISTVMGLQIASLLAGTIIIEKVFSIPGLGRLLLYSVERRDLPVVQGVVIWIAIITVIINLFTDFSIFLLDPRTDSE